MKTNYTRYLHHWQHKIPIIINYLFYDVCGCCGNWTGSRVGLVFSFCGDVNVDWDPLFCVQMGAEELAHMYNKMDRERHTPWAQTERSEEKRKGGEWRACQGRTEALFLFPMTAPGLIQRSDGTLNGLVVLNYQNLHGNDDYLLRLSE